MDDSETPRSVTDPLGTAPARNGKNEGTPLYLGIAATRIDDNTAKIGVTIHDVLSTEDYCITEFTLSDGENMRDLNRENTIDTIVVSSTSTRIKFVGAGATLGLEKICPGICAHIWRKLDIVCVRLKAQTTPSGTWTHGDTSIGVGGQAHSAAPELDGLNQPLGEWDLRLYRHNLHNLWNEREMNHLLYHARQYISKIARFDPGKGIPDVIESYRTLRVRLRTDARKRLPPQLLICGHCAIDDPGAEIIYNETIALLRQWRYVAIAKDIEDRKSGSLVKVVNTDFAANRLFDLCANDDLYGRMSNYAKASVSDEVGTDGNAACWLYLAAKLARGEGLEPNTGWIMDMAKEEAGQNVRLVN
ncbi:hypothetical protein HOY80DRAFT_1056935 [Tuber brumale]|nr:hypothetical protein HOY80DRAFT_1056935 [Tuber brumale]